MRFSYGEFNDKEEIIRGIIETIDDWEKMMGGRNSLKPHVASCIKKIQKGDKDAARNLYLFLSPLFFYIHILFEIARTEWRNAISWSGMFCERIVNNLLREISRK